MGNKGFIDWVNLLLGIWLIISPWVLGTAGNVAAQELLVILGIAVVIVSIWAMSSVQARAAEWWNVVLGIILFFSPWIFGYFNVPGVAWNSWTVGVVIAVLALINLPLGTRQPHAR